MTPTRLSVLLFFFLFFYSLLFHSGHFFPQDDEIRFRLTESLVTEQSFAIEPVHGFGTMTGKDGQEYPQYGPGISVLSIPLYLIGQATYPLLSENLLNVYRHDTQRFHPPELRHFWLRHWVSLFNHIVFGLMGVVLYLIGIKLTGNHLRSITMTVIFLCASFIFPYSRTYFSEPAVGLLFLMVFYFMLTPISWKIAVSTGILTGIALWVRQDSLLWAFLFLLFFLKKAGWHEWRKISLTTFIIILFGSFILYLNYRHHGNPFITGYEAQEEGIAFSAPLLISIYGFLFSTGRSLFLYSPVLIPALFTLPVLKKKLSCPLFYFLIATVIIYFVFYSAWQNWAGGWDWGPRHIYLCVPLLGVAFLLYPLQNLKQKSLFIITAISGFFIQFLGSIASFMDYHLYYLISYKNLSPHQFYQSLFVPDQSALAGHLWLIRNGYIDVWWYHLALSPALPWYRMIPPLLNIILVFFFLILTVKNLSDSSFPGQKK